MRLMVTEAGAAGRAVRLPSAGFSTPELCACCGAPAASSQREQAGAEEALVPYCVRCLRHASARVTRNLAAGIASCLAASTLSLALPLAWPSLSLLSCSLLVLLGSLVPLVPRALPLRAQAGHSAAERAAYFLPDGRLYCENPRFADAIASQTDAPVEALEAREPRFVPWLTLGPIVALIAAPSVWMLHHPLVRVLNLSDSRITVSVDGRPVLSLDPTSAESPTAGAEVRMPSGEHELVSTLADGTTERTRARLESGGAHLYAPLSAGKCFWLEETHYGRERERRAEVLRLGTDDRFWVLPRRVDSWFAPNPTPPESEGRSSGGTLVALRQAPCAQAPRPPSR